VRVAVRLAPFVVVPVVMLDPYGRMDVPLLFVVLVALVGLVHARRQTALLSNLAAVHDNCTLFGCSLYEWAIDRRGSSATAC
jgi:hypothetical protein